MVLALTERNAAATKFDGNRFLKKGEKKKRLDKLDQQKHIQQYVSCLKSSNWHKLQAIFRPVVWYKKLTTTKN